MMDANCDTCNHRQRNKDPAGCFIGVRPTTLWGQVVVIIKGCDRYKPTTKLADPLVKPAPTLKEKFARWKNKWINRLICQPFGHKKVTIALDVRARKIGNQVWVDTYEVNVCRRCGGVHNVAGKQFKSEAEFMAALPEYRKRGLI